MLSRLKRRAKTLSSLLLVPLMYACLAACNKSRGDKSGDQQSPGGLVSAISKKLSSFKSADNYLTAGDLEKFRAGRPKSAVLDDVAWRGYFFMSAEYKGKAVSAIIYDLIPDGPHISGGVSIWAIFADDKFLKFIRPPPSLPGDMEVVEIDGTPWSRRKPIKAGDNRFLARAMDSESVSIADLKADLKKEARRTPAPREDIDPGLTTAYLLMRVMGVAPAPGLPASEKDYLRNAQLRDQFNAARLNVGMTESEVEAVVKAKPIESGNVEAGVYRIYGSNESFNIDPSLHFSNILVVFREGKSIAISSILAGDGWRRKLGEETIDLPKHAAR